MATTKEEFITVLNSLAQAPLPKIVEPLENYYKTKLRVSKEFWTFKPIVAVVDVLTLAEVPGISQEKKRLIEMIEYGKKANTQFATTIESVLCDIINDPEIVFDENYIVTMKYMDHSLNEHISLAYKWGDELCVRLSKLTEKG